MVVRMWSLGVTLAVPALLHLSLLRAASAKQSGAVMKKRGDVLTMECTMEKDQERVHLTVTRPKMHTVRFQYDGNTKQLDCGEEYRPRVRSRRDLTGLTVRISDLQPADSGLYTCNSTRKDNGAEGNDVFLIVQEGCFEKKGAAVSKSLVLLLVVTACAVLLLCAVAVVVWMGPKVKALCRGENVSRTNNSVYEDMRVRRAQLMD
ncbi:uncharacterized protein LOC143483437 [Brachyhypopomus gauderio]|uniref:uncharacterized protein LOC143483437 n=1 Tax=Brachyhypopomus gauderio TaxID=698409 RepID=UPI004040F37C